MEKKEYMKRYREKNREYFRKKQKEYSKRNPNYSKKYYKNNKDRLNKKNRESFKRYREMALKLFKCKCENCGIKEKLEIHHKDENRDNNQVKNIKILWKKCHGSYHGKKNKKKLLKTPTINIKTYKEIVKNGRRSKTNL